MGRFAGLTAAALAAMLSGASVACAQQRSALRANWSRVQESDAVGGSTNPTPLSIPINLNADFADDADPAENNCEQLSNHSCFLRGLRYQRNLRIKRLDVSHVESWIWIPPLFPTPGSDPNYQPPRRSESARLALEFLAASAGAVGGGLGGFLAFRDLGTQRVQGDEGYTRSGNVGYLVGSFVGATLGAHLVGTNLGGRSPLWATSLGALVGTVPLMALGVDEPYLPLFGIALGWIPQGALAAGGFAAGEPR